MNNKKGEKMKKTIITILITFVITSISYYSLRSEDDPAAKYGLKTYYLVLLKKGENRSQSQEEVMKLQEAHLNNISRLAELGKIVIAGPLLDNSEIRGIFIFDADSQEEVEELCATDPAIKAGRLIAEVHPWMSEPGNCLP
jgi:uncharacterized protein YciI